MPCARFWAHDPYASYHFHSLFSRASLLLSPAPMLHLECTRVQPFAATHPCLHPDPQKPIRDHVLHLDPTPTRHHTPQLPPLVLCPAPSPSLLSTPCMLVCDALPPHYLPCLLHLTPFLAVMPQQPAPLRRAAPVAHCLPTAFPSLFSACKLWFCPRHFLSQAPLSCLPLVLSYAVVYDAPATLLLALRP